MRLQFSKIELFRNWDSSCLLLLNENSTIREYTKSDNIYDEGDISQYLYLVISGEVEIYRNLENGSHEVVKIYKPDEIFGEIGFFDREERENSALVKENSKLLLISRSTFFSISEKLNYEAWLDLLKYLAKRLRYQTSIPASLKISNPKIIVYGKLLTLSKKYHHNVITMSQAELGHELGLSRSTIIKILNELHSLGAIRKGSRMIMINEKKLSEVMGKL